MFFALLAVMAVASAISASAFAAAPTVLLLGEGFPLGLESGKLETAKSELQNAAGVLKGEGLLVQGELTTASAGNTFDVLFLHVKKGEETCTGEGEKNPGEVLTISSVKLVHDLSATTGVAALLTLTGSHLVGLALVVLCGTLKIKIEGTLLALLLPVGSEVTEVETVVHCSTTVGEPKEVKYWNEANVELSTLLLANFGTGFKKACEEIFTNTKLKLTKMAELMQ